MFAGEMASLEALRSTGVVRVPRPIKLITLPGSGAVFVMEYLKMRSLSRCVHVGGREGERRRGSGGHMRAEAESHPAAQQFHRDKALSLVSGHSGPAEAAASKCVDRPLPALHMSSTWADQGLIQQLPEVLEFFSNIQSCSFIAKKIVSCLL